MNEQNLLEALQKGTSGVAFFKRLARSGGNINYKDIRDKGTGDSFLISALEAGQLEIAHYLLQLGVNLHETNAQKETPLMYAVKELSYRNRRIGGPGYSKVQKEKCKEIVKMLLVAGADVSAVSALDMNVWNYAGRNREALKLLKKFSRGKVPKIYTKDYLKHIASKKEAIVRDKIKTVLATANEVSSPAITFLAGVPGAGKSRLREDMVKNCPDDLVTIDPDEFLEKFKEYGYDGKNAPGYSQLSEQIANQVFAYLVNNHKFNIVKDGTFSNKRLERRNVNRARRKGNSVTIYYVANALPYCFLNTIKREIASGRHVPCRVILDKYKKCVFTANDLKKIMGKGVTLNVYATENKRSVVNVENLEKYLDDGVYRYFYSNKQLLCNMKYDLVHSTAVGGLGGGAPKKLYCGYNSRGGALVK